MGRQSFRTDQLRRRRRELLLQEVSVGRDQPILFDRNFHRFEKQHRGAGLGQETKYIAGVDGVDGDIEVGMGRQEHPHGVRCDETRLPQKLRAAHPRHPHIGDDDDETAILLEGFEPGRTALSGHDIEPRAKDADQALTDVDFVVDTKDARALLNPHALLQSISHPAHCTTSRAELLRR